MTDERPRLAGGAEFDLIRRFLPPSSRPARGDVRVGPGDDCAVVAGEGIVLSSDMSVEDVHFRRSWLSAEEIGYRAAAAALSDLAAMAARPIGALVSLALPLGEGEWAVQAMAGVRDAVERVGGVVLGGDLTRSLGPVVVDVTVVGEAAAPVLRSGAEPGDIIWVTGRLGAAALAVSRLLRGEEAGSARERFARPTPRTAEALWLHERGVPKAMLDLSDGLAGDVAHLGAASGVGIRLEADRVPIHPVVVDACEREEALRLAVAGGEDYEICFAAAEGAVEPHREAFMDAFGTELTRVGRVVSGDTVEWLEAGAPLPLSLRGFQHFEDSP